MNIELHGQNISMIMDSGAEIGDISDKTVAMLNMSNFKKLKGPYQDRRGVKTITVTDYDVPMSVNGVSYGAPMSTGNPDQVDIFPLGKLIDDDYPVEMSDTELKVYPKQGSRI